MRPFSDSPIKSIISIEFTFQRCWITKLHHWGLKRIIFNLCHVKILREREREGKQLAAIRAKTRAFASRDRPHEKRRKRRCRSASFARHSARNSDERFEARWKPKVREKGDWEAGVRRGILVANEFVGERLIFLVKGRRTLALVRVIRYHPVSRLSYRVGKFSLARTRLFSSFCLPPPALAVRLSAFSISPLFSHGAHVSVFPTGLSPLAENAPGASRTTFNRRPNCVTRIRECGRALSLCRDENRENRAAWGRTRASFSRLFASRTRTHCAPACKYAVWSIALRTTPLESRSYHYARARALHKPLISSIKYYPSNERFTCAERFTIGEIRQRRFAWFARAIASIGDR